MDSAEGSGRATLAQKKVPARASRRKSATVGDFLENGDERIFRFTLRVQDSFRVFLDGWYGSYRTHRFDDTQERLL